MEKTFNISVFTEDAAGILNRITILFTRRRLKIDSITSSESELEGIFRYTIAAKMTEDQVKRIVRQLEKLVEVLKAFYHSDEEVVFQEIALYKIPTHVLTNGGNAGQIVHQHHARILTIEQDFAIIEKTGHEAELKALFDALESFGLLEFVKSGRVAISKPMKVLETYLTELEM